MNAQQFEQWKGAPALLADPFSDHTRKIQDRLLLTAGACILWGLHWIETGPDRPLSEMNPRYAGIALAALATYFCLVYLLAARADIIRSAYDLRWAQRELMDALEAKFAEESARLGALMDGENPNPNRKAEDHQAVAAESARRDREVNLLAAFVRRQSRLRLTRNVLELAFPVALWVAALCLSGARLANVCPIA